MTIPSLTFAKALRTSAQKRFWICLENFESDHPFISQKHLPSDVFLGTTKSNYGLILLRSLPRSLSEQVRIHPRLSFLDLPQDMVCTYSAVPTDRPVLPKWNDTKFVFNLFMNSVPGFGRETNIWVSSVTEVIWLALFFLSPWFSFFSRNSWSTEWHSTYSQFFLYRYHVHHLQTQPLKLLVCPSTWSLNQKMSLRFH